MLFASFSRNHNQINSEPNLTIHPLYDVVVDLFYMIKTHEYSHDLYLDFI
jgi:hypothetical protein